MNVYSVYVAQPTAWPGDLKSFQSLPWFSQYPHRNYEAATKTLWDWSRLFIGDCLGGDQAVIVSFNAVRDDKTKAWRRSVKWASVANGRLDIRSAHAGSAPSIESVRRTIGQGRCREVRQENYDEPF